MKRFYSTILIVMLTATIGYAQNTPVNTQLYVWTNSSGAATGESIVATLTFPVSGLYSGAAIVGQIIDGNSNWGQVLPTVANFKVNVNFSGSSYAIVQDVITPDVTLELKSISATQVILVANCINPYKSISIPFRFPVGNGSSLTLGDASIISPGSGTMLVAHPTYTSVLDGRLAINVTNISKAAGYTLAVGGSAIAESVTVKLQSGWPDFVFKNDYQLPSLTEVKTYIDENQHLPEIPSAAEVAKNGLDLGEMNKLLLKKVEELTLYLIESNRKQLVQDSRIRKLEQRLKRTPGKTRPSL